MKQSQLNLHDSTRAVVKQYLANLKGHKTKNLLQFIISEIEKGIIEEVLDFTDNNQSQASELLGITRTTLRSKRKKYQL